MLKTLSIKNFALIEDINVDFAGGLSIITGETGSGKSILLDALSLVLGKRAEPGALRNEEEKCVVEAEFDLKGYGNLKEVFQENELDYEQTCILRREIQPSGKSRAFLNDTPVTLDVLSNIGKNLVDIHSQHETQVLGNEQYQKYILDVLAKNETYLEDYGKDYKEYKQEVNKLKELEDFQANSRKEYDYNSFMLGELKSINLQEGMQEELEELEEQGSNVEEIRERLERCAGYFEDEEMSIMGMLRDLRVELSALTEYGKEYQNLFERIDNVYIELDDISTEVNDMAENVDFDPKELAKIQRKLQKIYDLQKKHGVNDVKSLIEIRTRLEKETEKLENIDDEIAEQKKKTEYSLKKLEISAGKLTERRKAVIPAFKEKLEGLLAELGMVNAKFSIEVKRMEDYAGDGIDEVELLFSANKGGNFGLLKKVASGGELSRIMLSVKAILAMEVSLPTIIFDEIDTGVSGEISHKMGQIMKQMSLSRQVFAITHIPQVAAQGDEQIKVYKEDIDGRTQTLLKKLSYDERVVEIAQMLGGRDITETARNHAVQLLGGN